jgi:predicted dehydrogenase
VEVVLADVNPDVAARLAEQQKLPWVKSVQDIFADPSILAVDICTPTPFHLELISQAVAGGKDFFCEKPLCDSLAQAQELAGQVNGLKRRGMIGYVYRFSPIFELGYNLFADVPRGGDSPVLGRVVSAFFRIGGRGSHQLWKHRREHGGGAINEMLVHMLDLALWYFGPVQAAKILVCDLLRPRRVIQGQMEEVDAEDYVVVQLQMASGVEVLCQADLLSPAFSQYVEIQGENGAFMGSIQPDMPSFIFCEKDAAGYPAGKTPLSFGKLNLFEAQMAEFIRMVRWQQDPARCTLRDSINLLETMEMLQRTR